jgi:hypothetical protein
MTHEVSSRRTLALAVAGIVALAAASSAVAATLPVANGGNLALTVASTGAGSSAFGNISAPVNPGNFYYHDQWTAPQTTTFGSTGAGFYDDFVFTIGAGQADSITSTISLGNFLGISGMQVRLYDYTANGSVAPLTTTPVAGSAFDAWSSTVAFPGGTQTVSVLNPLTLQAGTYVLEVKGTVTGAAGGNYTGSLNLTPVPLPAGLPMLLGGLGLFAGYTQRRRLA